MAVEKSENGAAFPYMKPPDQRSNWEKFTSLLYNKSDHTILGRTGKNWGQLLIFYTIFYICLAAFWAICLQGLFASLDDKEPTYILERSIIGTNPGMGFRPMADRAEEGSLIWYNTKNATQIQRWVTLLNVFLIEYNRREAGVNRVPCDFDKSPKPGQVCDVQLDTFGHCRDSQDFGFNSSSPCIYLKLNRIYGWVPEFYNDTENLPSQMPADLKLHIQREHKISPARANQVWISCQGENPADRERVSPNFEFFPNRGFPGFYYPYENDPGYLSPLVAVKVNQLTTNVIVNIECRAWAKNIIYRGGNRERQGSVHFEIMRDD